MTSRAAVHLVPAARSEMSRFAVDVAKRVAGSLSLPETLEQVVNAVVELLGFDVAALNLTTIEGDLEVVTVAGPAQVLMGTRDSRANWDALLALGRPQGSLIFVGRGVEWPMQARVWVPDLPRTDDPEAWHPDDGLFAPLHGMDGELLGVLSVDCPSDGRQPSAHQCELLELFAVQAALALDHARMHSRLEQNEAVLRRTFEQAPMGMAVLGSDRRLQRANPAYCAFLGRRLEDLVGKPVTEFSHPDDLPRTEHICHAGNDVFALEQRYVHADGSTVWGRLSLTSLQTGYGETHVLAQLEDVTAIREASHALERRATTDAMTGLANRSTVLDQLQLALDGPARTAVLFCDVDNFKQVNDTLGHAAGDALLVEIARNLQAVLRPTDCAGRLGGDEFLLVLHDVDSGVALEVAERARKAAQRALHLEGRRLLTSMTVGVAMGESGAAAQAVLDQADRALLQAKRQGRDRVVLA